MRVEIFTKAIKYLRRSESIETIKALKKRDAEINLFQQDVRRKVVTHYAVNQKLEDLPNGLVLLNMVVDVESKKKRSLVKKSRKKVSLDD